MVCPKTALPLLFNNDKSQVMFERKGLGIIFKVYLIYSKKVGSAFL